MDTSTALAYSSVDPTMLIVSLVLAVAMGVINVVIGNKKDFNPVASFFLGALLGLIGIIINLVRKPRI